MKLSAIWKGKKIEYRPGRLVVGLKNYVELHQAKPTIEMCGGKVDNYYRPARIVDVRVDPDQTLEIAELLESYGEVIRFADPEIIANRNNS